jgi:HAD superfamily hydrolase (TIGR01509 family)
VPGPDRRPAAVLWDFDGTLADTEPSWFAAEFALAAEHGAGWTDADARALVGAELIESGRYIRERMDIDLEPEAIVELLLDQVVADVRRGITWRPGARELLAALRAAGVPCALVTMSYTRLTDAALEQLPPDIFDVLVTGDAVEHGKPHPEAYLTAAARLGVDPADCVAIEDSPAGAASAEAAGANVLVVPHHVDVPAGPGRTHRASLEGLGVEALTALFRPA